jgi:hypothetical protein
VLYDRLTEGTCGRRASLRDQLKIHGLLSRAPEQQPEKRQAARPHWPKRPAARKQQRTDPRFGFFNRRRPLRDLRPSWCAFVAERDQDVRLITRRPYLMSSTAVDVCGV